MKDKKRIGLRVYLSGPITSLGQERAKKRFEIASEDLSRKGYVPVSPFNNGLPDSASYDEHMKADLKLLDTCDMICMLPGWSKSNGARIERERAIARDMGIMSMKFFKHKRP